MVKFEVIQIIDQFGIDIHLLVRGQHTFRTYFGALMTLSLCVFLSYSCNSFILEMNKGKNAILNLKETMMENNEGYEFNSSQFDYVVGMLDSSGLAIPNPDSRKIFEVGFYYCNKSLEGITCENIPAVICGERFRVASQKLEVPESYFNITYCISEEYLNNKSIIRLQGSERKDNFTLFGALIQKCHNRTDFQTCAPEEEIAYYTTNANLYYSYPSFEFNKELDGSPYGQIQNLEITSLYEKVKKMIKIYLQSSESQLEFNPFYWFPTFVKYKAVEYEKTIIDQILNYDSDYNLAQIEISLDAKKKLQFITYQTLMDVFAKIAGFFTILKMITSIFLYPIQNILYRMYLINFFIQKNQTTTLNDFQPKPQPLTISKLIKSNESRQHFIEQSKLIDKLLDIREILFNPLRLTRQMEDLYGSIKRFDASGGICKQPVNQTFDEIPGCNENGCLQSISPRTVNQEIRSGSMINFRTPQFQVR